MKKILLTVFTLLAAHYCQAQIQGGTWSLTGAASFSSGKSSTKNYPYKTEHLSFSFAPTVGYFVKDNLEVGIIGGYSKSKNEYTSASANVDDLNTLFISKSQTDDKVYNAGIFSRYYKFITANFAFFGQLDAKINFNSTELSGRQDYNSSMYAYKNNSRYFSSHIKPGVMLMLSNKLSLNATYGELGYTSYKSEYKDRYTAPGVEETRERDYESDIFELNLRSSSASLGLSLYF